MAVQGKTLSNPHLRSTGLSDAPRRQAADKSCLLRFA